MAIDHDGGATETAATRIIAEWPPGSFLENLVVLPDGGVLVTVHSQCAVDQVAETGGAITRVAVAPVPLAGLALGGDGTIWASGGVPGTAGGSIWRWRPGETPLLWCDLPDALFLNGMAWSLDGGSLLVADSLVGRIFAVSTTQPAVRVWLESEMLRPGDGGSPGANGIRLSGRTAFISNTDRNFMLSVPLDAQGAPGEPFVFAERLRADDFDVAADGSLFIATHPANSVVRFSPSGRRATIAGVAQGAVNPTSVRFARDGGSAILVTTTGGVFAPLPTGPQPARLLRLDIDAG